MHVNVVWNCDLRRIRRKSNQCVIHNVTQTSILNTKTKTHHKMLNDLNILGKDKMHRIQFVLIVNVTP
jgi:hypothetical protein